jgi:hypothetical protein
MGRHLPRDYEPIPDAALHSGADLVDVVRRIARNQNWIWANQGAVVAAFGQEPLTTQEPTVVGSGSLRCAYFAAPGRSTTGSPYLRVVGILRLSGNLTSVSCKVRVYQLLAGEAAPSSFTPYDETEITVSGSQFFSFPARVRSGTDPLVCCVEIIGAGTATYYLHTLTVLWEANTSPVLGETPGTWSALSQAYVAPDRSANAALLRAASNLSLGLLAANPQPLFCHCFAWTRSSTGTGGGAGLVGTVPSWIVRTSPLLPAPWVTIRPRFLVTGQGAARRVTAAASIAGTATTVSTSAGTVVTTAAFSNGAYVAEGTDALRLKLPAGEFFEIRVDVTSGGGGANSTDNTSLYPWYVGASLLGVTITQDAPAAADLGLPGADVVPAAYQPIDDLACAPRSAVVAQNDRIGRRAGLSYLVKNLIWLAANRSAYTMVADWLHRTQHAGHGTNAAGDAMYRNTTVFPYNAQMVGTWHAAPGWFPGTPGWADRTNPTNANELDAAASPGGAGHHYPGDALVKMFGMPLTGGKIGGYVRTEVQFVPGSPSPTAKLGALLKLDLFGLSDPLERLQNVHLADTTRPGPIVEWATLRGQRGMYLGAATPTLRLSAQYYENIRWGLQVSLLSAFLYEMPLTQADLDALA